MNPKIQLTAETYTVGLIYVKPLELHAISVMFDEFHKSVPIHHGDSNEYTLGRMGKHNVALVGPPRGAQGKAVMADVVGRINLTFKNIGLGLLVGIGGGVPHFPYKDVRLGDVVVGAPEVGPAVVQYDLGRRISSGKIEVNRTLNKPPAQLLRVVDRIENEYQTRRAGEESDFFSVHLERYTGKPRIETYKYPPSALDRLFKPDYFHGDDSLCSSHNERYEIVRAPRKLDDIRVHYSTILSGDEVMKHAETRDEISAQFHDALCFEMEAAGVVDTFPCLIIRGICDYCDSHKNDKWQHYAAATAAAYARQVLLCMAERLIKDPLSDSENLNPISSDVFISQSGQNYGFQLAQNTGVMNLGNLSFGKFS